jgi:hypothetical protein
MSKAIDEAALGLLIGATFALLGFAWWITKKAKKNDGNFRSRAPVMPWRVKPLLPRSQATYSNIRDSSTFAHSRLPLWAFLSSVGISENTDCDSYTSDRLVVTS